MRPGKIVCIGWNYSSHIKELESELPKVPTVFLKPSSCIIGDGDTIVIPDGVTNVQHEVELALVFGKRAKNVSEAEALSYVSHLAVFNDVSARDMQKEARASGNSWDLSKGMDTFGPMSEPVPIGDTDVKNLDLSLTVNGELRQSGNTRDMIFPIPFLISYISRYMALEEGDILITGTPEGVSEIRPGDVVCAKVEGIGSVTNPVAGQSKRRSSDSLRSSRFQPYLLARAERILFRIPRVPSEAIADMMLLNEGAMPFFGLSQIVALNQGFRIVTLIDLDKWP